MLLGTPAFYKFYSKNKRQKEKVSKGEYLNILKDYYKAITKVIIYDSFDFYQSNRMGSVSVYKYNAEDSYFDKSGKIKKNNLPIDWVETLKLWEEKYGKRKRTEYKEFKDKPLVYLFNDHSDGFRYIWHWDKRSCIAKNQSIYHFRSTRTNKRLLANAIKNISYLDYKEI